MEKAVSAKVSSSGLVKFLGDEAKDAEVKGFFIDNVVEGLMQARSANNNEIKIISSIVTDFLADYEITVEDTKKLQSIAKELLEFTTEERKKQDESKKSAPAKSAAPAKGKGKKEKKKGKGGKDDDDDEEADEVVEAPAKKGNAKGSGKGKNQDDDEEAPKPTGKSNKNGKSADNEDEDEEEVKPKKGKQEPQKGKGKKGKVEDEEENEEPEEEEAPKGKKGGKDNKQKGKQEPQKGKGKKGKVEDEEEEQENEEPEEEETPKGKKGGKDNKKGKPEPQKGGKGKQTKKDEEEDEQENEEPEEEETPKGKKGKDNKKGKPEPQKGKGKQTKKDEEEEEEEPEEEETPKGKKGGKDSKQKGKPEPQKGKGKKGKAEEDEEEQENEEPEEEETPKGKKGGKDNKQKGKQTEDKKGKSAPKPSFAALEDENEEENEPEEEEEAPKKSKGGKQDKGKGKDKGKPAKGGFAALAAEDENEEEPEEEEETTKKGKQAPKEEKKKGKEEKSKAPPTKGGFTALAPEDESSDVEEPQVEEKGEEAQPMEEEKKVEPPKEEPKKEEKKEEKKEKEKTRKEKKKEKKEEKKEEIPVAKQEENEEDSGYAKSILQEMNDQKKGSDSMSKDIKVDKFDISFPGKILFKDATLMLNHGRKYGLVAPNGTGKSTLLTAIASRTNEFEQIPKHFDILYVEQEVIGDDTIAIDSVVAADVERLKLLAEEKRLMESNFENAGELLAEIHARLDEIEAYSAEARASSILTGLQFTEEMKKMPTKSFSGGWRMRIALARALFRRPTLLLLDEPTNHLDLLAVIWLETYLQKWKNTLLIVSHDQDFLNSLSTDIIHIYQTKLDYYKGNYDKFKHAFGEKVSTARKAYEKQQKLLEQSKQQKKKQDQKQKDQKTKERVKVIRNKQKKGKKDQDQEEISNEAKELLEAVPRDYNVVFEFPDPDSLSIPVIQVDDASFGYTPDKILFKDLNFGIDMDSRIALVGPNGAGKSTLLKLLLGELEPVSGVVNRNRKLVVGRFTQHFVDKLNMKQTAVEYLHTNFSEFKPEELRGFLGRFGLTGQTHVRPISSLSGGQKSRVVFTEICMRNPHLLFLDEPTNHLDIESVEALAEALNEYKGGLILVSHDARLISEVCGDIWVVSDNTVTKFDGGFDEYRSMLVEEFEAREREEEERRKEKEEERRKKREEEFQAKQAARLAKEAKKQEASTSQSVTDNNA